MWAPRRRLRRRLRRLTAYKMIEFYDCRIIPVIIRPFSYAAAARRISLLRSDDSISGQILVDGYMKREKDLYIKCCESMRTSEGRRHACTEGGRDEYESRVIV